MNLRELTDAEKQRVSELVEMVNAALNDRPPLKFVPKRKEKDNAVS